MCRRGDIFWAELGRDADGSLQAGGRLGAYSRLPMLGL